MMNIILSTDSYKTSHFNQYPKGTEYIYSYVEARSGDYLVPVLGLTDFRVKYLETPINSQDIKEAQFFCEDHGVPFNKEGWEYILKEHGGYLPLILRGLPEGTVVKPGTPMATLVNSDPMVPWLVSYMETALLRCVWGPSTVAAKSRKLRGIIKDAMEKTCDDLSGLQFKLHDFGARGCVAPDVMGMGHLAVFRGTDNMDAVRLVDTLYSPDEIAGFSIPATEHSTVTSWGPDGELEMYKNLVKVNKGQMFACVIDSYNQMDAIDKFKTLESSLVEHGSTLVIRPDSGDPVLNPIAVLEKLFDTFGYNINTKGCRVLPSHIRMIQGDGLNEKTLSQLVADLVNNCYSLDNIAFGMGGGLLQDVTRDTCGFAMKCSAARVNGAWRDVQKVTPGKTSKAGLVIAEKTEEGYYESSVDTRGHVLSPVLPMGALEVYYSSEGSLEFTWDSICERCN